MQYNPPRFYRPFEDAEDDAAGRARSNSSMTESTQATTDTADSTVSATTGSSYSSGKTRIVGMDTGDTLDPRYELIRAAGPPINEIPEQFELQYNYGDSLQYAQYPPAELPPFPNKNSVSLLQKNPAKSQVPDLFSINSQNRDTTLYPYASYFTLHLPRTYKNVTAFNVVQISFPTLSGVIPDNTNALGLEILREIIPVVFDVSANETINYCEPLNTNAVDLISQIIDNDPTINLTSLLKEPYDLCTALTTAGCSLGVASCLDSMFISEDGRVNPVSTDELLKMVYSIPPGRYVSDSIVDALNQSFGSTMYFELIGFDEYKAQILAGEGAIVGFPYPLQYFYNNLTGRYTTLDDPITARSALASFYYPSIDTIFSLPPTNQEIFVSYFYPVLKEVCIDPNLRYLLDYSGYDIRQVYSDVVTGFFGLNYPLYVGMCEQNVEFLTRARRYFTQEYYVVNQYTWYYNSINNRIGVTFNTLNRSIKTTISQNYAKNFSEGLSFYGTDIEAYDAAKADLASTESGLPVVEQMAAEFASSMAILGVEFIDYNFNDISNNDTLLNTENTTALVPGYKISQTKAGTVEQTAYAKHPNPYYGQWPNMINMTQNYLYYYDISMGLPYLGYPQNNFPYSFEANYFLVGYSTGGQLFQAIDPSSNEVFITNGSNTDLFVNVRRSQYVIIPFRTPNKQNVQVSTISRPYFYRFPANNIAGGGGSSGYANIPGIGQEVTVNSIPPKLISCQTAGVLSNAPGGPVGPYDYFNYFDNNDDPNFDTISMTNYNYLYNISFYSNLQTALASPTFDISYQLTFLQPFQYFRLTPPLEAPFDSIPNPVPDIQFAPPFQTNVYLNQPATLTQVSSRYNVRLTILPYQQSTFTAGIVVTVYNDYALFTADLNRGIENSVVNYLHKFEVAAGDLSGNLDFVIYSYAKNIFNGTIPKYYYIKVSQKEEVQDTQIYQLALWNETNNIKLYEGLITPSTAIAPQKPFSEYTWDEILEAGLQTGIMSYWHACALDPDFNAAGYTNGVSPLDYPFNSKNTMFYPFIGHDTGGISTDLTDYRGFYTDASGLNPEATYYADPVTGYYFKLLTDYSDTTHTYFFTGSENAVYNPSYQLYSFSGKIPTTLHREFKLTHWWDTNYIGPQNLNIYDRGDISYNFLSASSLQVYEQASIPGSPALYGYKYYNYSGISVFAGKNTTLFDYNSSQVPPGPPNYNGTRTVLGFSWSLPDGIYKIKQLTFKSAFFGDEADDPNADIEKLLVFNAGQLNGIPTNSFPPGNALSITGEQKSPTLFQKDLTGITNCLVVCSQAETSVTTTSYEIIVNDPFEGQNFVIGNITPTPSIFQILLPFATPSGTSFIPSVAPGGYSPFTSMYVFYKYGRWNYYYTDQNFGNAQIKLLDKLLSPIAVLNKKSRVSYGPGGNAINPNADKNYGTYYTYEIDSTYANPNFIGSSLPTAQIQTNLYSSYVFVSVKNVYSTVYGRNIYAYMATPITLLAGSLIPNPEAGIPTGSTAAPVDPWPSTNGAINSPYINFPNEQSMIIPLQTSVPPYPIPNFYQSQYAQSMPISTCGILIGAASQPPYDTFAYNPVFNISFQSFWPVQNIIFERVDTTYKPMTNLTNVVNPALLNSLGVPLTDGSGAFEYPRTQLFYYDNLTDLFADISDSTDGYRWGFESRYQASSTTFNGFKNNSYIYDITPNTDSVGYLLLRAYSPAEQFQTVVRFAIKDTSTEAPTPGLYTFGLKTTDMITSEYLALTGGATNFAPDYANALTEFYTNFIGNFVYGTRNFPFDGFNILTFDTNYFLDMFRELWANLQAPITLITNVDDYAIEKTNEFIQNRYSTVLPSNLLTYSALTGDTSLPVTFYSDVLGIQSSTPFADISECPQGAICDGVLSAVQNSFACFPSGARIPTLEVQVGFPFQTVTAIASLEGDTNNVINSNLYMQINTEQPFNNMNVALNELDITRPLNFCPASNMTGVPSSNRTQNSVVARLRRQDYASKEFRGSAKIANGKIILNNSVDNVTQTYLQSPTTFSPPLGKLQTLTFKVLTNELFPVYQVYPYVTPELEWNAILSITEEISNIPAEEITQVARVNVDPNRLPF